MLHPLWASMGIAHMLYTDIHAGETPVHVKWEQQQNPKTQNPQSSEEVCMIDKSQ